MAFEEGTERLVCSACGAEHAARWSRMPVREHTVIRCMGCNAILYGGNTVRDYFQVTLLHST
jgi:hypothetical protein